MSALALLRWAAGHPGSGRDEPSLDGGETLRLLAYHGLTGRALQRLEAGRPRWADPRLAAGLRAAHEQECRWLTGQLTELRRALSRLPPSLRVLVLKGATAYAVTGDRATVRRSADVDLLCDDPEEVARRLMRDGFEHAGPDAAHELADLTRGDLIVDLHRHYPAYRYPPGLTTAGADPAANPGVWRQHGGWGLEELDHAALAAHGRVSARDVTAGLAFLDATAAAVVACCHCFNSYHYAGDFPKVRVGELADVVALCRDPGFSRRAFADLVSRAGAADAVALAQRLVRELVDPTFAVAEPARSSFPQDLWWGPPEAAFLADLGPVVGLPDVLTRRFDARTVVRYLRPARVPLRPAPEPGGGGWAAVDRLMLHSGGAITPAGVAVAVAGDPLTVDIRLGIAAGATPSRTRVHVNTGIAVMEATWADRAADWAAPARLKAHTATGPLAPGTIGARARRTGAHLVHRVRLPLRLVDPGGGGDVAMIVGAGAGLTAGRGGGEALLVPLLAERR